MNEKRPFTDEAKYFGGRAFAFSEDASAYVSGDISFKELGNFIRWHVANARVLQQAFDAEKSRLMAQDNMKCDGCGTGRWSRSWWPESLGSKSGKFYCPNCSGAD